MDAILRGDLLPISSEGPKCRNYSASSGQYKEMRNMYFEPRVRTARFFLKTLLFDFRQCKVSQRDFSRLMVVKSGGGTHLMNGGNLA